MENNLGINFRNYGAYLLVSLLAVFAFKVFINLHAHNLQDLSSAAYGVIIGKPHWLAYQNRLLGPYLVLLISEMGIGYGYALVAFDFIFLQILCFLVYMLLINEGMSIRKSFAYLIVFLFAFLSFQHDWYYTWDSIDLIVFALFGYGIVKNKALLYFVVLYFVELLNRESALFLAVYISMSSFEFVEGNKIKLRNKAGLVVGGLLFLFGAAYTKIVRDYLFVSKPNGRLDIEHEAIGSHVYLLNNIKNFFFGNFTNENIVVSLSVMSVVFVVLYKFKAMNDAEKKLSLMILFIFANIFIFGSVDETRMYFALMPMLLFLWVSVTGELKNDKNLVKSM